MGSPHIVITSKMREILVDWLIGVHAAFKLSPESLYLTINIVDRFLSVKAVPRRELQLVGMSSMLIACKYEELWAPEVDFCDSVQFKSKQQIIILSSQMCCVFLQNNQVIDFITISDNAYVREQVLLMEKVILEKLEWHLTVPTPYVFLVRYVKASVPADKKVIYLSFPFFFCFDCLVYV